MANTQIKESVPCEKQCDAPEDFNEIAELTQLEKIELLKMWKERKLKCQTHYQLL